MSPRLGSDKRVAIVTGAERGIGAGLAAAYRAAGYAVVGTSLSIPSSDDPDFLTVQGDITEPETAQRVVEQGLDRFGRIDSLINNAGIYISKPFTEYTAKDYAAITAVNLGGFSAGLSGDCTSRPGTKTSRGFQLPLGYSLRPEAIEATWPPAYGYFRRSGWPLLEELCVCERGSLPRGNKELGAVGPERSDRAPGLRALGDVAGRRTRGPHVNRELDP